MRFKLHVPQPSSAARKQHINHPRTLEAINHWVDAFVCGCSMQIMHLRLRLIFLCLEWPCCTRGLSDVCSPEGHERTEDLETEYLEDNRHSILDQGLQLNQ